MTDQTTHQMLARYGARIEYPDHAPDGIVSLVRSDVSNDDLECLAGCSDFTALDLQFTTVSDAGMQHIGRISQLETLELGDTLVSDDGLRQLGSLKKLETLGIGCAQG